MWCFLKDLSLVNRPNEEYYFHFVFLEQVFENIDGAIQCFVCNDECLALFITCATKTFLNGSLEYDWRQPFMATINCAISTMVKIDQESSNRNNEVLHQSTLNMLRFTLKYFDP